MISYMIFGNMVISYMISHTHIYMHAISLIYRMISCMISYFCNDVMYIVIIIYDIICDITV
jgi:hypothetical protein